MSQQETQTTNIHPQRLFLASCLSLIATSVAFAVIGDIMGPLKTAFVLTNEEVGKIGGAALWGFTLSIIVLGPLCDFLKMRNLLRFSFVCHLVGPALMMFAKPGPNGFWTLFAGALILALGNGTVEAACNPLVATIYPENKTTKLNQFHVWFPGGIVIGGLLCFLFGQLGLSSYKLRLALIMIPALIYGVLFAGQKFPLTERVQSGVSFGGMVKATLGRPLFLVVFLCMGITASLELGPNRWIPSILQAGGMHGILVLVWISGLMAVLRFFAGPIVHRISPTGMLLSSAILSGCGLYWLSFAESMSMALAAATVFAFGVCYFWPTMLGVVAERVPKGGALALALMGGMGMLASGMVASPQLGRVADLYLPEKLPAVETRAVVEKIAEVFPKMQAEAPAAQKSDFDPTIAKAVAEVARIKANPDAWKPTTDTANVLRAAIGAGHKDDVVDAAGKLLNPADNFGGRMAFRKTAPWAIIIVAVFGILYLNDRRRGGYKVEKIA